MSAPSSTPDRTAIHPDDPAVPGYVKQQFRVKAFTLVTVQYAIVLIIMLIVEYSLPWEDVGGRQSATTCNLYIGFGIATGVLLLAAYMARKMFPWNYLLLAIVTVLVGVSWGVACSILTGMMHFHIVAMIGLSMLVATIVAALLTFCKNTGDFQCPFAGGGMLLGLLIAFGIDMALAQAFPDDIEVDTVLMSAGIVLLLILVTFADAGRSLASGNPDEFLRVVIGMTSALLVVYTIPLFLAIYACRYLSSARKVIREDQNVTASPTQPPAV